MFNFLNLDSITRDIMLQELELSQSEGNIYFSDRLNDFGKSIYVQRLKEAVSLGDEQTLAVSLQDCFKLHEPRKSQKGGSTYARVPSNANKTLAEGEFNRLYIRALCIRALKENRELIIYRAKDVSSPRPESEDLIGKSYENIGQLLNDLRNNKFFDDLMSLPPGPNSGLSVRLS